MAAFSGKIPLHIDVRSDGVLAISKLLTTTKCNSGCGRPWPVGASRVVSRLIKVAFLLYFLDRFFPGNGTAIGMALKHRYSLEIGKYPLDPILNGLLVQAEGPWPHNRGHGDAIGERSRPSTFDLDDYRRVLPRCCNFYCLTSIQNQIGPRRIDTGVA